MGKRPRKQTPAEVRRRERLRARRSQADREAAWLFGHYLASDEAREREEQIRRRLEQADREDAWMFAQQLACDEAEERKERKRRGR